MKKPKPDTKLTPDELQEQKDLEKFVKEDERKPSDMVEADKPQDVWTGQWDAPK